MAQALYHADGNGNVVTLWQTNGTLAAKYLYDPFGGLLAASGPLAGVNRYRFSSKEWEDQAGLYYYGYRFYDPNMQRWVNRDPIGEWGGINLYGYVANDPINSLDPLGLLGIGVTIGGSANVGIAFPSAGATGSVGAGYFSGAGLGTFASGGAFFRDSLDNGGRSAEAPNYGQSSGALGAYAGVGAGLFITNAKKPCDLNGPFKQWNLDTPIGSISYANSDGFFSLLTGTWNVSVTVGPGDVGSISAYSTTTVTATPFSNLPSPTPNGPMPGTPGSSLPPFSVP